jgi:hypothetical protein
MPRLTLLLLTIALLAAVAGATYALRFNPEMDFWKEAAERKLEWADQMRAKHGRAIGIIGGSTTTFGIDAEILERGHGLPVVNLGLHAGMGPEVCSGFGFAALRPGDTLIVSLEPSMLTEDLPEPTSLGVRMAWALRKPEIIGWDDTTWGWQHMLNPAKLQPGGYHVLTMLGKLALGHPLYRYHISDSRPGGLQVTAERRPSALNQSAYDESQSLQLSDRGRALLARIRHEARARGILVAYLLPWAYADEDHAEEVRSRHRQLLDEIVAYLPMIREPELGVWTKPGDFADSRQHLTEDAAQKRSSQLALLLHNFLSNEVSADD